MNNKDSTNLFFETLSGTVVTEQIDCNGHLNISEYAKIIDLATTNFVTLSKINSLMESETQSFVAARVFYNHYRELLIEDSWRINSGILKLSKEGFTLLHIIFEDSNRIAKIYIKCVFFDKLLRKKAQVSQAQLDSINLTFIPGIEDPFEFKY